MEEYEDTLSELNKNKPLSEKIRFIHAVLKDRLGFIDRIAVATYEAKTDLVKTFLHSSEEGHPLARYQAKLADAGSLREIVHRGRPRVVNDLAIFSRGEHSHTRYIAAQGYESSYTLPIFLNGLFFGFIFFNSYQKNCFQVDILRDLDVFGHLISSLITNELTTIRMMISTVQSARHVTAFRDTETGAHIDRVSHYARIIAKELAPKQGFRDEFIEYIFLFAPLHDVGKIGLPDAVLKKKEGLTREEFEEIKSHVLKGRQIIDSLIQDFGLDAFQHVKMLSNIVEFHHEAIDGSGYARGIRGDQIPIEARIIAVADIFDALTSRRPYKESWTNDQAFSMLQKLAGLKLDGECVEALLSGRAAIEEIQTRFKEQTPG